MNQQPSRPHTASPRRRSLRGAVIVSFLFHGCLLVALLVYRPWQDAEVAPEQAAALSATSAADGGVSTSGARPSEAEQGFGSGTASEEVKARLDQSVAESQQRPDEENLRQLQQQIEQLDRLASQESIDQLAARFRDWLGTRRRAERPADAPVAGKFDASTGQLFEVARVEQPDGRYAYRSVLCDAQGRTMEVEMDAVEGQRAYQTMTLLRRSPLAENLYRQIAVPLLDKMLYDPARKDPIGSSLEASDPVSESTVAPAGPSDEAPEPPPADSVE